MKVREIMSKDPSCCTPENSLVEAATLMKDCDCGAIPVVDDMARRNPIGIITDRDIVIRAVAENKNPATTKVENCMTGTPVTVNPEDEVEECIRLMEQHKVRRIPVVDDQGALCGIVVQAHIARKVPKEEVGEVVGAISEP